MFLVNNRRKDGSEATQTTMRFYFTSIPRFFKKRRKTKSIFSFYLVLDDPVKVVRAVCYRCFAQQLSRRLHVKSHDVLGAEDLYRLFSSMELRKSTAVSLTTRLRFAFALQNCTKAICDSSATFKVMFHKRISIK